MREVKGITPILPLTTIHLAALKEAQEIIIGLCDRFDDDDEIICSYVVLFAQLVEEEYYDDAIAILDNMCEACNIRWSEDFGELLYSEYYEKLLHHCSYLLMEFYDDAFGEDDDEEYEEDDEEDDSVGPDGHSSVLLEVFGDECELCQSMQEAYRGSNENK